jgi:glycosyltransferase involved in cell wall biosynthesis
LRHADAVIVHSRGLAKGAAASLDIPPSRIHVIPHGQYAFFDRKRFTRSDARARLNIPKEGIVILCLGVIREYKGIDTALEALAHLPTKYILVIAGHNWEPWDKYRAIIDAHALADRVRIDLRYIPDEELELFYKAADVSLLSYKNFEGQSGQAITAAAFGVPIVASQVGGLVDLIEPEFTAKPGDAIAFANSIKAAVNRGTTTVIPGAAPSWPEVALKTEVLYRHLTMS